MTNGEMDKMARELLQAKHRREQLEMRDRYRERKERTRRLIQRGAILEKALKMAGQDAEGMSNEALQQYLIHLLKSQ